MRKLLKMGGAIVGGTLLLIVLAVSGSGGRQHASTPVAQPAPSPPEVKGPKNPKQPTPNELALFPEKIAVASITRALIWGELIRQPTWPMKAEYALYRVVGREPPLFADITCFIGDSVMCGGRDEKKVTIEGASGCYEAPGDGDGCAVEWTDGGYDCTLVFKNPFFVRSARAEEQRTCLHHAADVVTTMRRNRDRTSVPMDEWKEHIRAIQAARDEGLRPRR